MYGNVAQSTAHTMLCENIEWRNRQLGGLTAKWDNNS